MAVTLGNRITHVEQYTLIAMFLLNCNYTFDRCITCFINEKYLFIVTFFFEKFKIFNVCESALRIITGKLKKPSRNLHLQINYPPINVNQSNFSVYKETHERVESERLSRRSLFLIEEKLQKKEKLTGIL